jgi:ubiquinone/menaquinone biosynthesis C-methylase UbiE
MTAQSNSPTTCPASERAFDPVAQLYDAWFETPLGQTVDRLEKDLLYRLAELRPSERVLDVGTGTAHFAVDLTSRGGIVIGVDLSHPMLEVARGKSPSAHLVLADAAALPLRDGQFDLVFSVTMLEFVAQPEQALNDMWRVVRPGGRLVIGVINALSPWASWWKSASPDQKTPFDDAHFFHPSEFVGLLRRYGHVSWSSSVFFLPSGVGMSLAWTLERIGRALFKPVGALLVGRISKCT